MAPVWNEVKSTAIDPYTQSQSISWEEAWSRGVEPIKRFMARQIELTQNTRSIALFYRQTRGSYSAEMPASIDEVPLSVMLPAFLVSELKVAFLLGFQILLPFLVLDFVVSTVTVSMGMLMLPPTMVSFPLKLILFVMVDGWNLVVGMLLQSLGPIG
jgi:flagellar biosynthetic protein FliP